ncbi:hypothetical protein T12_4610 [Trichinella patagoniensis]|uniref:FLYWCH-type domain-containing protein n=1 Tax=Trichinella patagoniensis TaxID=990121 RepID=A0A0V0Z9H3_9BILA|nr:hypothetical protein T12_4610 [Trichinella patagoniensis]
MADVPELHLVQNRCGGTSLVYEGRAYKLKRAGTQKYWRCSQDKEGCGGAVWPASSRLTPVLTCGTGRKAVARSILIFLLVSSCWRYRVFNPSSPTFLCTAW